MAAEMSFGPGSDPNEAWIAGQRMHHICDVAYCFQIPALQAFGPPISSILHGKILVHHR
jgi:hypothetical protein